MARTKQVARKSTGGKKPRTAEQAAQEEKRDAETQLSVEQIARNSLRAEAQGFFDNFIGCRKRNETNAQCFKNAERLFRKLKNYKDREFIDQLKTELRASANDKREEPDLTFDKDINKWFARFNAPKPRASKKSLSEKPQNSSSSDDKPIFKPLKQVKPVQSLSDTIVGRIKSYARSLPVHSGVYKPDKPDDAQVDAFIQAYEDSKHLPDRELALLVKSPQEGQALVQKMRDDAQGHFAECNKRVVEWWIHNFEQALAERFGVKQKKTIRGP
jgi:hypothetical protein